MDSTKHHHQTQTSAPKKEMRKRNKRIRKWLVETPLKKETRLRNKIGRWRVLTPPPHANISTEERDEK